MPNQEFIPVNCRSLEAGLVSVQAFTAAQVREIDRILISERGIPGLTLMKRAASASVALVKARWPNACRVQVFCGSGNNAADGFIVAGMLSESGIAVEVVQVGDPGKLTADGQSAYQYCKNSPATMVLEASSGFAPDLIVDALLGTGFRGHLADAYAAVIKTINGTDAPVLALDVPSGLALDDEQLEERIVRAAATITFIALKRGLMTGHALDYTGLLFLAPLHPSADVVVKMDSTPLLSLPTLLAQLPERQKNAHKFRFGHVLVIGGDRGMGGAPLMTGLAAIRCGAGLVSIATHPDHAPYMIAAHPELMIRGVSDEEELKNLMAAADVIAMGPGLGTGEWGQTMLAAALASELPIVLDADGLNLLSRNPVPRGNWILTPHPGEARRLLDRSLGNRFSDVLALQERYGGIAVLKGAGTLIAAENGISICPYGNPGMSTAGMGDVLCGVIAGVLGQCKDPLLAARLGVALHSAAADAQVARLGMRGLMATDVIPEVRRLINET